MHRSNFTPKAVSFFALACLIAPLQAQAHLSQANAAFSVGTGTQIEEGIQGQYGFAPSDPFFVGGEAIHGVYASGSRDDFMRFGIEGGYEARHFAVSAHFRYLLGTSADLTLPMYGGELAYRFVSWEDAAIPSSSRNLKSKQQLEAEDRREAQRLAKEIPMAPLAGARFDAFSLGTPASPTGGISGTRFGAFGRLRLHELWTLFPSADLFMYGTSPTLDSAGNRAYASRSLRLIRLGPDGGYSVTYGSPKWSVQAAGETRILPQLSFQGAITVASIEAPSVTAYSFWLSLDRFLDEKKRWALSPSYEQVLFGSKTLACFSLRLRWNAGQLYFP